MFYAFFQNIWQPVYPCVYREHEQFSGVPRRNYGLSLCIQGTCFHEFVGNEMERFIPVYTGNMIPQTGEHQVPTVYPCVYREHY